MAQEQIFIGTSNVVLPGNKKTFPLAYQSSTRLSYYSTLFNSVEINQSFYKTPLFSTYKKWAGEVPDDFTFTIKVSKQITHAKNLDSDISAVHEFMQAADGLGAKKGCLLVQFPGKIGLESFSEVEKILKAVREADQNEEWRIAVEFRNASWYISETTELLNSIGSSLILHDHLKGRISDVDDTADFIYLRFHGPQGDYRGSYTNFFLQQKAAEIKEWKAAGKIVYVYFNNTIGDAFNNARYLRELT